MNTSLDTYAHLQIIGVQKEAMNKNNNFCIFKISENIECVSHYGTPIN